MDSLDAFPADYLARTVERLLRWTALEPHSELGTCYIWTGVLDRRGYGAISLQRPGRRRQLGVHRLGWLLLRGPIPDKLEPDHLCRVHACWNPEHLELVTRRVNVLRGEGLTAQNARKVHCPAGHAYTGTDRRGYRRCQPCDTRQHAERRKARG